MLSAYTLRLSLRQSPHSADESNLKLNFLPLRFTGNIRFRVWVDVFVLKVHVRYTKCCSMKTRLARLLCMHALLANIFSRLQTVYLQQANGGEAGNQNANTKTCFVVWWKFNFFLVCSPPADNGHLNVTSPPARCLCVLKCLMGVHANSVIGWEVKYSLLAVN